MIKRSADYDFIRIVFRIFLLTSMIVGLSVVFSTMLPDFLRYFRIQTSDIFVPMIILNFVAVALLSWIFFARSSMLPKSYNVAILGFPESGKTTLLVSLFDETFLGRISLFKLSPRGSETIERVNQSLSLLKKGESVGPTKDQDRFSFRADITYNKFIFPTKLKVEFGDFPGESSKEYVKNYGLWLHTTEYFKWVIESDAIILIVDLGKYLRSSEHKVKYITEITGALRAAWQQYLDINKSRRKRVISHPLRLVFAKADLLALGKRAPDWIVPEQEILQLGFGNKPPPFSEIKNASFDYWSERVLEDFSDLVQYFKRESANFDYTFTSSFGLVKEHRLGLEKLIHSLFS